MSEFKCPQCGGFHFNSTTDKFGTRIYICKGIEVGPNGTGKGYRYLPPCGWRGYKESCFSNNKTIAIPVDGE